MRKLSSSVSLAAAVAAQSVCAETVRLDDFVWENGNPEKVEDRSVPIEGLKPGMCAEVTMWVDASGWI